MNLKTILSLIFLPLLTIAQPVDTINFNTELGMWIFAEPDHISPDADKLIYKESSSKPFTGIGVSYHDDDKKIIDAIGLIENGKKQGYWTYWWSTEQIWAQGNYVNGIKEGTWTEYSRNGGKSEGSYKNGIKEGYWIEAIEEYGAHSREGNYKAGKEEGLWTYYDGFDGKKVKEGNYKDGEEEGLWTHYEWDGSISGGNYHNGRKEGNWKEMNWKDGKYELTEISYKDGVKTTTIWLGWVLNVASTLPIILLAAGLMGLFFKRIRPISIDAFKGGYFALLFVLIFNFGSDLSVNGDGLWVYSNHSIHKELITPTLLVIGFVVGGLISYRIQKKSKSTSAEKRNWNVMGWGCLAPFVVILVLAIKMFGGGGAHPQDAGAAVGAVIGLFIIASQLIVIIPAIIIAWLIWFLIVYRYNKNK